MLDFVMVKSDLPSAARDRVFERKVRLGTYALFFERLWPRLWWLIAAILLFVLVSMAGFWSAMSAPLHKAILSLFAIAIVSALIYLLRTPWPVRDDAIRRIERRSGVAHRPASSYEDTLSASNKNEASEALWLAHRDRLKRAIARLKVGKPEPRTDRSDPFAARMLLILAVVPAIAFAGNAFKGRMLDAFHFGANNKASELRIDAWITPPAYTSVAPVMLIDGGRDPSQSQPASSADSSKGKLIEIPEKSVLTFRGTGISRDDLVLEVLSDGATEPKRVVAEQPAKENAPVLDTQTDVVRSTTPAVAPPAELRFEIQASSRIRALADGSEVGLWTFDVIHDLRPDIVLTSKKLSGTPRGSMKLEYKATDDYGVASAVAKVKRVAPSSPDALKFEGPRLPFEPPPVLPLKLQRPGAKTQEASTLLELGPHPWAGQRVQLWLEATDIAGKVGRSDPVEIVLPIRRFKEPLARAVIEQRRKLVTDSRYRTAVIDAIDALTMEPDGFIKDLKVYLGLRTVGYRLRQNTTREGFNSAVDQLWQIALTIEDGALSEAERAMKDAQDKLSKALQEGASDEELQKLMQELKQALNDYMKELQKQAEQKKQDGEQQDENGEEIAEQDIQQMMKDLEESAKNGSRDEAEKMLSELRELMDRLQAQKGGENKEAQAKSQETRKKMDELGDLVGKQKQLMDDTFGQQRQSEEKGQGKRQSKPVPGLGQKGAQQGRPENKGSPSADGSEGNDSGQGSSPEGQGQGQERSKKSLAERQAQLRDKLNKLKKELEDLGTDSEKLGDAEDAMDQAEKELQQDELGEAARQQGEALSQMRQGAQQMVDQMMKEGQQRFGQNGDTPRDPLGRPQQSKGPDLGNSVKVPDQIDAQKAREILDELRRRSGEALRPSIELDYIDRLLRRF